jgi:hypothetical protein
VPARGVAPPAGGVAGDVEADLDHQHGFHQRDVQRFPGAPPGGKRRGALPVRQTAQLAQPPAAPKPTPRAGQQHHHQGHGGTDHLDQRLLLGPSPAGQDPRGPGTTAAPDHPAISPHPDLVHRPPPRRYHRRRPAIPPPAHPDVRGLHR